MSLDLNFIIAPSLQQYFVDKDTGLPLSGGKVYFYSDVNRTDFKTVYELSGLPPNYQYSPLANPITLSASGTIQDDNGNDVLPYYYCFDEQGQPELYYVVVYSAGGVKQFERQGWPNVTTAGGDAGDYDIINYVPNGQFLLHTDLPDNRLVSGSNVIAQGGFTFELPDPVLSENLLTYIPLNYAPSISRSPRFIARVNATPNALDTIKSLRVKWNDVNKFSYRDDFYTFAFWADSDIQLPIAIRVVKYFGTTGSSEVITTVATDTIFPGGGLYQYNLQFGNNSGFIIDTVNNNDYVALEISLPVGISFRFDSTDFVLTHDAVVLTSFPLQTNADMVTRGNDGWTNIPDYTGKDLYLPKVQTRVGYQYDEESVGDIGKTIRPIISPLSAAPLPKSNRMAFDGAIYLSDEFSTIGIPFSRLGNVLIEVSPLANTPLWGTGPNFVTSYVNNGNANIFRLTVNSNGAGANYAADGGIPTGFNFQGIPVYNGSITGGGSLNYLSFSSGVQTNQIICRSTFNITYPDNPNNYAADGSILTGFPFYPIIYDTGIYAQQAVAFAFDTVPASALINGSGNQGAYYYFYSSPGQLNPIVVWFNVFGEIQPTTGVPGGALFIQVNLEATDTAADVANTLREIMVALQSTNIEVTATPIPGSYFIFQANPLLVQNYHVWYSDETGGIEPIILGSIGINVKILSVDTFDVIATKTLSAINKYQYQIPNAAGMFFRNTDPDGVWDFDNLTRWSNVTGIVGPSVGTFEYSQLFSHNHFEFVNSSSGLGLQPPSFTDIYATRGVNYGGGAAENYEMGGSPNSNVTMGITSNSGGSETRPVNMYANYYIKY